MPGGHVANSLLQQVLRLALEVTSLLPRALLASLILPAHGTGKSRTCVLTMATQSWLGADAFMEFYRSEWKAERFVIFFGYYDERARRQFERQLRNFLGSGHTAETIASAYLAKCDGVSNERGVEYTSGDLRVQVVYFLQDPQINYFTIIRPRIYQSVQHVVAEYFTTVIVIDSDELLYVPKEAKKPTFFAIVHYVDLLPGWTGTDETRWSVQPMLQPRWQNILSDHAPHMVHTCKAMFFCHRRLLPRRWRDVGFRHVWTLPLHRLLTKFHHCGVIEREALRAIRRAPADRKVVLQGQARIPLCFHLATHPVYFREKLSMFNPYNLPGDPYGAKAEKRYSEGSFEHLESVAPRLPYIVHNGVNPYLARLPTARR
jgi:hypothetical protein